MASCPLHEDCEKELDELAQRLGYISAQDFVDQNSVDALAKAAIHDWRERQRESGWSERMGGGVDGHPVTVKFGYGENEGHILIDDGDRDSSNRSFDRRKEHNHYGPKREDDGHIEEDRGHYTGSGP